MLKSRNYSKKVMGLVSEQERLSFLSKAQMQRAAATRYVIKQSASLMPVGPSVLVFSGRNNTGDVYHAVSMNATSTRLPVIFG